MKQNADGVCALARCAGNPKGVVLTHKNVLATVAALQTFVREVGLDLGSDDSTLSYLTLAHILGRALEEFALSVGASIGYWQVCTSTLLLATLATVRSSLVAPDRHVCRLEEVNTLLAFASQRQITG